MAVIKKAPRNLKANTWCPGCGHGIFIRLVQEILEEKGLDENNVAMVGVGCSANIYGALNGGNKVECHHGRAPVSSRAFKALMPQTCVWTYQGDGDAYSIGMGETMLAAQGDYPITMFVINNCNYGMTGGQMAQTTLPGQITTTTPKGREGHPMNVLPMICTMDHVSYVARGTTASVVEINKLKRYMSKAIDMQMKENKFAIVEILTPCPTNWHMNTLQAADHVLNEVVKYFPLGEFKG